MIMKSSPEWFDLEFLALKKASVQIGQDSMLIQAAGGNTSIKDANVMWIKASGKLLSDADNSDIFVPVDLPEMQKALKAGEARADMPAQFLLPGGADLRPSIETSLHAVFPQRVVMHAHCIHTLVYAVQVNGKEMLAEKFNGLNWGFVQYAKPGANLARLVAEELKQDTNVIVLGNHGVIVAGDTVAQTVALLYDVHNRLGVTPHVELSPNLGQLEELVAKSSYELPDYTALHQLALDPSRLSVASAGSLYPDHVIFCGIGASVVLAGETLDQAVARLTGNDAPVPVFLIVPDCGVVVRKGAGSGAHALMRCLVDLIMRLPKAAQLNYLTLDQNLELLDWDAEKYRQALNAKQ